MATETQDKQRGNGEDEQQAITVQRDQDQQLSRGSVPTTRRLVRTSPFSMMRRMLDDLDDLGTRTSLFGLAGPFATMRRMFDEMERLFDPDISDIFGGTVRVARDFVWAPLIEVTHRGDHLLVRAELPGIPQDQIQIYSDDNTLVIEGERTRSSDEQGDVWASERAYGRFRRTVVLPEGADPDKAQARYENGVLEVSVPLARVSGRRIEIQTAGTQEGQEPQLSPRADQDQPQRAGQDQPQQAEQQR